MNNINGHASQDLKSKYDCIDLINIRNRSHRDTFIVSHFVFFVLRIVLRAHVVEQH